jgi:hypothetical protein
MAGITLHLRSECKFLISQIINHLLIRSSVGKALEHRSALTPTTAKTLIYAGYTINVERSPARIFDDAEFEKVGATLYA